MRGGFWSHRIVDISAVFFLEFFSLSCLFRQGTFCNPLGHLKPAGPLFKFFFILWLPRRLLTLFLFSLFFLSVNFFLILASLPGFSFARLGRVSFYLTQRLGPPPPFQPLFRSAYLPEPFFFPFPSPREAFAEHCGENSPFRIEVRRFSPFPLLLLGTVWVP